MRAQFDTDTVSPEQGDAIRHLAVLGYACEVALEALDIVGQSEHEYSGKVTDSIVQATQRWAEGDYSRPAYDLELRDDQVPQLLSVYQRMRMTNAWPLIHEDAENRAETIDHIIVLGTIQSGNDARLEFLKESMEAGGVTPQTITLAGGERDIFPETEGRRLAANIAHIRARQSQSDPWVQAIANGDQQPLDETDLLYVSALDKLGSLSLRALHLHDGLDPQNAKPGHHYELDWGGVALNLMHTRAVERNGKPRHTTEACLDDWVKVFNPEKGSKIAIIANQPHLWRVGLTADRYFKSIGRPDLKVIIAGPTAPPDYDHATFLKEVTQTLYELKLRGEAHQPSARPNLIRIDTTA